MGRLLVTFFTFFSSNLALLFPSVRLDEAGRAKIVLYKSLRALHLILKYAFVSIKAKILIVQKLYVYKYLKSSALENQSPKSLNHENSCTQDFVRITLLEDNYLCT